MTINFCHYYPPIFLSSSLNMCLHYTEGVSFMRKNPNKLKTSVQSQSNLKKDMLELARQT